MNDFAELDTELKRWSADGITPRFFLRDDDAIEPGPALDRLLNLTRRFDVPLLLAVIPALATSALAERLVGEPLVTPCTHGYAHRRHTPVSEKAVELGGGRPVEDILAELSLAHRRMHALFGDRLSGILVPPWNRIAPEVAARIHELGFTGLSVHAWKPAGSQLPEINTQIDIVDWHDGRRGRSLIWAAEETARRLRRARERGGAPLGILSHHLVHDEQAWVTLEGLISHLRTKHALAFRRADDLVRDAAAAQ
ncbi:polysaccharide deacetylase [Nitratireductor mangrovi]|uniref:Polysaccharide deacetylase n=1 Tax=Nitratireductor mangrovi TaxID=2599600 RepID=A0A5B8L420_9HYPH|nr:polysaccharide deacetylase family protein [Nitratireductor mangrovi]QDZ02677.1 polysaccharide deacetylase [Nitratireductor mangrovi]